MVVTKTTIIAKHEEFARCECYPGARRRMAYSDDGYLALTSPRGAGCYILDNIGIDHRQYM